ncbi:MAG: threonine/serine exporter family protein [Lachnospiraceae bacterium]|nr:threonine/serine exporter family protein [Lachnospiraceae bacterium]
MKNESNAKSFAVSQILYEALNIGEQMLICGAEVRRVEDTIFRICQAYGMKRVDVFTITSSIIVTVQTPKDEIVTQTRRIAGYEMNLSRLSQLNALSREICARRISPDMVEDKIRSILTVPPEPVWQEYLCYCLVSGMFTLFFGGGPADGLASVLTGALLCVVVRQNRQRIHNRLLAALCSAVFTGLAAGVMVRLGLGQQISKILIGNIMLLIPGIPLTNSIRDMLSGDTMSGILRLCESLLLAVAIAGGMVLALYWLIPAFGNDLVMQETAKAPGGILHGWYEKKWQIGIQIVSSFFGSLGYAMLFHIRGQRVWLGALGGMAVWIFYLITGLFTDSIYWGFTLASMAATCYGEWLARREKTPATLFLVPAVIPLIPGGSLYDTMYCAVGGDYAGFLNTGLHTLKLAAAISIGILVASSVIQKTLRGLSGVKK